MRLEGPRVRLRPLAATDGDLVVRWRSDPDVAWELFSERPPTRGEHDSWFRGLHARTDRREFVIIEKGADRPIGTIGLSAIDEQTGEAEYGILIGEPTARGKGLAREASDLILRHAFDDLGLASVRLELFADNAPALRLYRALGFEVSSVGRRIKAGTERPTVVMRLYRGRRGAADG